MISDRAGFPAGESSPRAGICEATTNTTTATSDDNQTERQIIGGNSTGKRWPVRNRRPSRTNSKANFRALLDRFKHFLQSRRASRAVSQQTNQEPVHLDGGRHAPRLQQFHRLPILQLDPSGQLGFAHLKRLAEDFDLLGRHLQNGHSFAPFSSSHSLAVEKPPTQ